MSEFCETCVFWVMSFHNEGKCYRYPPVLNERHNGKLNEFDAWIRPVTKNGDWCGEWKGEKE